MWLHIHSKSSLDLVLWLGIFSWRMHTHTHTVYCNIQLQRTWNKRAWILLVETAPYVMIIVIFQFILFLICMEFPRWLSGKESTRQCRRRGFDPWSRKIPWRRKWQPTPVFWPENPHGQRTLAGCSPQGRKNVRYDLVSKPQQNL